MAVDVHMHPHRRSVKETHGGYGDYDLESELLPDGTFKEGLVEGFLADSEMLDHAIVLAVAAPKYWIRASNEFVSAFAKAGGEKVIGFAGVDPNSPTAVPDLEWAVKELGLRGLKLSPIYQDFEPDSRDVYPLYERVQELGIPIIWHQGTSLMARFGPLEAANPVRLDVVLRDFPDIKMVFSHMAVPWATEAVLMMQKHPQLYMDISATVMTRPWFVYNALVTAMESGCMHKVLFASDYPWYTPAETRAALYALAEFPKGTNLPKLPMEELEAIVNRDSVAVLGI